MKLYTVSMHLHVHVHVTCLTIIIQVHCRLGLSLLRVTARGVTEDEFSLLCARFTSVVLVMLTTVGSAIGFWSMEEVDNVEFDGKGAVTTWSKMFKDQININIKQILCNWKRKKTIQQVYLINHWWIYLKKCIIMAEGLLQPEVKCSSIRLILL